MEDKKWIEAQAATTHGVVDIWVTLEGFDVADSTSDDQWVTLRMRTKGTPEDETMRLRIRQRDILTVQYAAPSVVVTPAAK